MEPIKEKEGFEQELQEIEELELKAAPDASDTVLPLPWSFVGRFHH